MLLSICLFVDVLVVLEKYLALFFVGVLIFGCTQPLRCVDSDGGADFFQKGTVSKTDGLSVMNNTDWCKPPTFGLVSVSFGIRKTLKINDTIDVNGTGTLTLLKITREIDSHYLVGGRSGFTGNVSAEHAEFNCTGLCTNTRSGRFRLITDQLPNGLKDGLDSTNIGFDGNPDPIWFSIFATAIRPDQVDLTIIRSYGRQGVDHRLSIGNKVMFGNDTWFAVDSISDNTTHITVSSRTGVKALQLRGGDSFDDNVSVVWIQGVEAPVNTRLIEYTCTRTETHDCAVDGKLCQDGACK
ncbi:hypothetical protein HY994_06455 [Candidatus Micrarchaeota archaeon]|nr:hypothetical protein [Candidatus Micrarchaeota archaeon]